jgi:hypothetical protein
VTQWTLIADYYGEGQANWRTLAMMHTAMHDALNAAHATYGRWWPRASGEPAADGAVPEVAMAAAASEVLSLLHPKRAADTATVFADSIARFPDGAGKVAGIALGRAIGRAVVERRARDGFHNAHLFQGREGLGRWRPTPTSFETSQTNEVHPFLFDDVSEVPSEPPLALDTPRYLHELAETRRLGGIHSSERTPEQTTEAYFWAYQSSQRGFVDLAVRLFAAHPLATGVHAEARVMAELTTALADSAILTWNEKEKYSFWRPITAIRAQGDEPAWVPLLETPPFPEYPSGHATDCYVGAGVLDAAFPKIPGPITYRSSAYIEPLSGESIPPRETDFGMGQHAQWSEANRRDPKPPGGQELRFQSLSAVASDCAAARVWAGAHFWASEVESKRLADIIVRRALGATPEVTEASAPAAQLEMNRHAACLHDSCERADGIVCPPL